MQEKGHEFEVNSAAYNVRGTIALVSADNPASNGLGGFKESASADRRMIFHEK